MDCHYVDRGFVDVDT